MSEENSGEVKFVPVYRAPKEIAADIVRGLLESEGIPVLVHSVQVPMFDGALVTGEGYWGDLLVQEDQADRAREIIRAYEQGG